MNSVRCQRGSSLLPVVWITGALFVVAVGAGFLARVASGGNFLSRASRAITKTFADVFRPAQTKPVFEINLAQNESAASSSVDGAEKSSGTQQGNIFSAAPRVSSEAERGAKKVFEAQGVSVIKSIASSTDTKQAGNKIIISQSTPSSTAQAKNNSAPEPKNALQDAAKNPACDFSSGGESSQPSPASAGSNVASHKILVNEIAWMGSDRSASDEWMELRNNSGGDIALAGWQIKNQDESLKIIFTESEMIPAGEFYLLERTNDQSVPNVKADKIYVGGLSNGGEWIRVFDKNCGLVDEVNASDGWPGGDKSTKKTLERNVFDFEWHTSPASGGSPRAKNLETIFVGANPPPQTSDGSVAAPQESSSSQNASSTSGPAASSTQITPQTAGRTIITEVMAGTDAKSDYEFVELYNSGGQSVDLTGWTIKKKSSSGAESPLLVASRLQGKSIGPGKYFLAANENYNGPIAADVMWAKSNTLAYTSNSIALYDASSTKIDEVFWSEIPKNQSYERQPIDGATFIVEPNPNPRNSNN